MAHNTNKTIINDELAIQSLKTLEVERLKLGLSRIELAVKAGISESAIDSYEGGKYLPTKRIYNKLAKVFNWPLYQSDRKLPVQRPVQRQIPITMPPAQETDTKPATILPAVQAAITSKLTAIEHLIKDIKEQINHV